MPDNKQLEENLFHMNERLIELEEKISSIDQKLSTVIDAILGNSLTKTGGFMSELEELKIKVNLLETSLKKQEDFRKKILWTIGIVVSVALILEFISRLWTNITL